MRTLAVLLVVLLSLGQAQVVVAQLAVAEVNSVAILFNNVKSAIAEAQQVVNTYTQIQNQVRQIQHQVTNLQRFDLNYVTHLLNLGGIISGVLKQARGISYDLDSAVAEFDRLYPAIQGAVAHGRMLQFRLDWATQRQQAAQVGMQVQAVTSSLDQTYTKLCELLNQAVAAKGNLDINQIQAQQQGVTQGILLQIQQQLAGNARGATSREAEDAALTSATLHALEQAGQPEERYTGTKGSLTTYSW